VFEDVARRKSIGAPRRRRRQGGRLLGSHQLSEPSDIDTLTGKIAFTHIRCLIAVSENMSFDQATVHRDIAAFAASSRQRAIEAARGAVIDILDGGLMA
jgi:hypothetical protein